MPAPSIRRLVQLICSDEPARRAAAAVKEEVDDIYGYSKYTRREIDMGLESRLYSMTYLAKAIKGIIEKPGIEAEYKKTLASDYLRLLDPYRGGRLPKRVYDWRFEPDYTIEPAVFLDTTHELDWRNHELLDLILEFGAGSTVESKERFLERLVDHINRDEATLRRYTSPRRVTENHKIPLTPWDLSPLLDLLRPEELTVSPTALNLLKALGPLLTSRRSGKNVSLKALGRLGCLTGEDIAWLIDNLILFRVPNRVEACRELYEILIERGVEPETLLGSLIYSVKKAPRSRYSEHKVKGLLRAISRLPMDKSQLAASARELLDSGVTSEARLSVYKFIYEETGDREVLERAGGEGAKKIREWAQGTSRGGASQDKDDT